MSLHLEFEPHAWYMEFAIRKPETPGGRWEGYTADGMRNTVIYKDGHTLDQVKAAIRTWHLDQRNGYGERIAARRLEYLRGELRAERISYGELAELEWLAVYIPSSDTELLEAAGVPEGDITPGQKLAIAEQISEDE